MGRYTSRKHYTAMSSCSTTFTKFPLRYFDWVKISQRFSSILQNYVRNSTDSDIFWNCFNIVEAFGHLLNIYSKHSETIIFNGHSHILKHFLNFLKTLMTVEGFQEMSDFFNSTPQINHYSPSPPVHFINLMQFCHIPLDATQHTTGH